MIDTTGEAQKKEEGKRSISLREMAAQYPDIKKKKEQVKGLNPYQEPSEFRKELDKIHNDMFGSSSDSETFHRLVGTVK